MSSNAMSPNHREILSARSTINGRQEYLTSTNGILNINGTFSGSSLPISGASTGIGVAILDTSGNQITSFGGGTQYTEGVTTSPATLTIAGGRYLSADPTLTNNQLYALRLDNNQRLMVNPAPLTAANDSVSAAQSGAWTVAATQSGTYNIGTVTTVSAARINDSNGNAISAFPATFLRTTDEPHQLFYDAFDTAIDTTNRWTSTTGSSGVAAANTTGVMAMGTGTVANGYSKLTSQPTFTLPIPAWLGVSDAIALPDGASPTANSYRYWGTGTTPATPTVAAPMTDGYGFELNTDGKLRAVVYASGTRTVIADLSASTGTGTQPVDASYHRYIIYIRTDKAYWYIDGISSTNLVATSNFQSSSVQSLPRLFLCIGNSTPPVSNTQIQCTGATAWDTGKNNSQLSDATFPWRKATVSSGGALTVNAGGSTGTQTSVASSASNVTLLAANTLRKGGTITNESTAVLYVKLGSTSSLTSYTVSMAGSATAPYTYYEIPFGYTGIVTGIWASATGNSRITEIT